MVTRSRRLGFPALGLGTQHGVELGCRTALAVLQVELHGQLVQGSAEAQGALTALNHHRQHVGKLVALRLGQALKLPEAEMLRLLLTAGVIPLAGKAEVVVGGIAAV